MSFQVLAVSTLETQVKGALSGLLTDAVPALLAGVLSGIDHALEGQTLTLDQAPLPAVTLSLDGRVGAITPRYRDQLLADLSFEVASASTNRHPESLGAVAAVLLVLGRYTGYRLTELYRFQDVIVPEPSASAKAEEKREEPEEVVKPGEMAPAV